MTATEQLTEEKPLEASEIPPEDEAKASEPTADNDTAVTADNDNDKKAERAEKLRPALKDFSEKFKKGSVIAIRSTAKASAAALRFAAKASVATLRFTAKASAAALRFTAKASVAALEFTVKFAALSAKVVSRDMRLILANVTTLLTYIGSSAWNVAAVLLSALWGSLFSFCKTLFGTVFGWFAKKLKQPLYEILCFILTPFAHAWGHFAHAHIRLKKASKRGFFHAVGSWLYSFWSFLCGVGEVLHYCFNYIAPVISVIFLISLIRYASTLQYAITVEYNGSELGTIGNEAAYNEAQALVQDKITFTEENQTILTVPKFSVKVVNLEDNEKQPVDDIDMLSELMIESGDVSIVYAYALNINEELFGVYVEEDMITIRDALNNRLNQYNSANDISVNFEDDIVITEGRFIESVVCDPKDALELINGSTTIEAYYVAQSGDSVSSICSTLGITQEDFERDNPDLGKKIHKGDIITYHYSEPHLNVITTHYENYDQVIERVTEYVESSKHEKYCEILLQHGSDGFENVTALVTEINGKETERVVVSRTILEEMVPRKFRVGTKENTYLSGSDYDVINALGTMVWPLGSERGYISSLYGYRKWDHSNHGAIDIAGIPRGTDIYAAADGKVTFSGSYAAYGKLVIIDNGHGYESYYGHCSELDVKVGDRVEKGDVIAHVGMTGSASGNHLHFEMRHNGKRFDPLIALGGVGGHEIRE